MKTLLKLSSLLIFLVSISFCTSSKSTSYKLIQKAPFTIKKATFQEWVAGVQGGGSGITVKLSIENLDSTKIVLDSLYFRMMGVNIKERKSIYIGSFKTKINERKEIVLRKNPIQEYGNVPPEKQRAFPFELENNEAIISYTKNKKLNYFKVILKREESPKYQ